MMHPRQAGFTLLEITFAMAIFMIVLGAVAQSLVYSFHVLVLEQQRTSALNGCKSMLSTLRQVAYSGRPTEDCPEANPLFPCVLLTWVQTFPETLEEVQEEDMERFGPFFTLPQQQYAINCLDTNGNVAQASEILSGNSNPVVVTVTTTWVGMRDRDYSLGATAIITDR